MLNPGVGGPHAGREEAGATVRTVDVKPEGALSGHRREPGQVIDDAGVRGARCRHDHRERAGVCVGLDRGAHRRAS